MLTLMRSPVGTFRVNDPLEGMALKDLFSYPEWIPKKLQFLQDHIQLASELGLVYKHEMLRTGVPLDMFHVLYGQMVWHDLEFLPVNASKIEALQNYYLAIPRIPLRMLFFGTPIALKLEKAGIASLPNLLSLNSSDLDDLIDEKYYSVLYTRKKPTKILTKSDILFIRATLDGYSLPMRDATQ